MKYIWEKIREWFKTTDKKKLGITLVVVFVLIFKLVSSTGVGLFDKGQKIDIKNIKEETTMVDDDINNLKKGDKNEKEPEEISIYVSGEVASPGVIKIKNGAILNDAILKLGGLTKDADSNRVNLAVKLEDGGHYIVPKIGDDIDINNGVADGNGNNTSGEVGGKININVADEGKLKEIPGVGPSTAKKIIDYRNDNGKFNSIEELKNVSGIGDKKFESMKDSIIAK